MKTTARQTETYAGSKLTFADADARAELAELLDVLTAPQAHAGPDVVEIKRNARRVVWRIARDGRRYYLKQYCHRGPIRRLRRLLTGDDARRELALSRKLRAAGVPAVEVLAIGVSRDISWMLSRAVEPSEPGDQWHNRLTEAPDQNRRAIRGATRALARLVAGMHEAGVLHKDLHTGNVLVSEDPTGRPHMVLTDLHRAAGQGRLPRRWRAKNLAQLLHDRRHFSSRTDRLRFLIHYLRHIRPMGTLRGWQRLVEHFADAHTRKQYRKRDRRCFGQNKYFARLELGDHWRAHVVLASKRRPDMSIAADHTFTAGQWLTALSDPAGLIDTCEGVVKDAPSGRVVRRTLRVGPHELQVYCKRHRRPRPWGRLCALLRPSRAARSFQRGHALLTRRIPTALPLATLTRRLGPWITDSILITEAVVPAERLNRFLTQWLGEGAKLRDVSTQQQQQIAHDILQQLGRLLRRLQEEGFAHRDLKNSNLLVLTDPPDRPHLVLVGLNGLRRRRLVTTRRAFQMLMRLNVALLESPVVNHAGRLRMLLGYLRRPGCGEIEFKPYWRWLERWSANKLNRQIAQRQRRQRRLRRESEPEAD